MMKRTIVLSDGKTLTSAMTHPSAPCTVPVGIRTVLSRAVDLMPFAVVPEGACGTVVSVDHESGAVEVELDDYFPGLRQWFNTISLVPFDTDDILDAFQVIAEAVGASNHLRIVSEQTA